MSRRQLLLAFGGFHPGSFPRRALLGRFVIILVFCLLTVVVCIRIISVIYFIVIAIMLHLLLAFINLHVSLFLEIGLFLWLSRGLGFCRVSVAVLGVTSLVSVFRGFLFMLVVSSLACWFGRQRVIGSPQILGPVVWSAVFSACVYFLGLSCWFICNIVAFLISTMARLGPVIHEAILIFVIIVAILIRSVVLKFPLGLFSRLPFTPLLLSLWRWFPVCLMVRWFLIVIHVIFWGRGRFANRDFFLS